LSVLDSEIFGGPEQNLRADYSYNLSTMLKTTGSTGWKPQRLQHED